MQRHSISRSSLAIVNIVAVFTLCSLVGSCPASQKASTVIPLNLASEKLNIEVKLHEDPSTAQTNLAEPPNPSHRIPPRGSLIPFELSSNHVYVQVRVGKSTPLWFMVDTGAGTSALSMRQARRLGLKLNGQIPVGGAGANAPMGAFVEDCSAMVIGLEGYPQPITIAIPFDGVEPYEGRHIDGVLGYDFFEKFVLEIDYQARNIHVYVPDKYRYSGAGESIPLTFKMNHPHVRAQITVPGQNPIEGDFVIDMGSRRAVALTKPFVADHKLLQSIPRVIEGLGGAGVGGASQAFIGRLESIKFGRFVIRSPIATLSRATGGVFATNNSFDGNIGGELLRRFKVVFDYSRKRMILEPNRSFSSPFVFDMSGAQLAYEGEDLKLVRVRRIGKNTPAENAGVREGDIVEAVDGRPTSGLTIDQLQERLMTENRHTLLLRRDENKIKVTLLLTKRI